MYDYAAIYAFLSEEVGVDTACLKHDTSLQDDLGVAGDDFDELVGDYAERFGVDISGYRWYFHHDAEGSGPADLFFKQPSYERIAVTPTLLLESANAGRWMLEYPQHRGPRRRIHQSLLSCLFILVILMLFPWAVMRAIDVFSWFIHRG
jgi:hypothetical protein